MKVHESIVISSHAWRDDEAPAEYRRVQDARASTACRCSGELWLRRTAPGATVQNLRVRPSREDA